jgi:hypothetical protein
MAKKVLKKADQGTKVPVSRVREVADSLMDSSTRKKRFAAEQKYIGDGTVKNKVADKQVLLPGSYSFNGPRTLSGNDRLKIAEKARKEASTDSSNAVRYRALADKAMKDAAPKKKMGGMIKRADGSMSKRGLWDNIRANKGSGKKPTSEMLKQEKKIKAQTKKK